MLFLVGLVLWGWVGVDLGEVGRVVMMKMVGGLG